MRLWRYKKWYLTVASDPEWGELRHWQHFNLKRNRHGVRYRPSYLTYDPPIDPDVIEYSTNHRGIGARALGLIP